jgi:peptidylprolyl isomerase
MKIFYLIFVFLFFTAAVSNSQEISKEVKEILMLQDTRSAGNNDELISFLYSTDSLIRHKALTALANIGDSSVIPKLDFLLAGPFDVYPTSGDFEAAAFMLGQIPCYKSRETSGLFLKRMYDKSELEKSVLSDFVIALGNIGTLDDLNNLYELYNLNPEAFPSFGSSLALSTGKFALNKIKNEKSSEILNSIAGRSDDTSALRNAAFAYWRTGSRTMPDKSKEIIYSLSKSDDPQIRMWAYNAFGKIKDKLLLMQTLESFSSEKDWRVKVNMLNSISNYDSDSLSEVSLQIASVLGDAISDSSEHVSLTGLKVLGKIFSDLSTSKNQIMKSMSQNLKEEFIYALDSADKLNLSRRVKNELVSSVSLMFRDEMKSILFREFYKTDDYDYKAGIIKSFGNFNDGMIYREVRDSVGREVQRYNLQHPDNSGKLIGSTDLAKLYRAFVEMLTEIDDKVDSENQNNIRLIYSEFAGSKDILLTDLSLSGLYDSLYIKYRDETNSVINFEYKDLSFEEYPDIMLMLIDAMGQLNNQAAVPMLELNLASDNYELARASAASLEKITGKKYGFHAKPVTDFDWDYIQGLSQKKNITVITNKGNIRIELFPETAPFTVMNFLKLSEKNFYDGTVFHRVVPNFVIQGGDPTGTGFGGPGYSIRSEFSPLNFETGMLGMASSGKDTEGSQFFITHSATPHLNGRYTLFGRVTEGMDVVDKIMIGDSITDIIIDGQ